MRIHGARLSYISRIAESVLGPIPPLPPQPVLGIRYLIGPHLNPQLPGSVPQGPLALDARKGRVNIGPSPSKGLDPQAACVFTLVLALTHFFYCHFPLIPFFIFLVFILSSLSVVYGF